MQLGHDYVRKNKVHQTTSELINETKNLVVCGYPVRDLDRLQSFYLAAKKTGRYLVIEPKQAYLLKLFRDEFGESSPYPDPQDSSIKVYMQKGEWGLIDKDINVYTRKLLDEDYKKWARPFLDYPNVVDYRDVSGKQSEMLFTLNDYKIQELIDIKPKENSGYIRSLTEPFNDEMEFTSRVSIPVPPVLAIIFIFSLLNCTSEFVTITGKL